jgi:hypothetical protein
MSQLKNKQLDSLLLLYLRSFTFQSIKTKNLLLVLDRNRVATVVPVLKLEKAPFRVLHVAQLLVAVDVATHHFHNLILEHAVRIAIGVLLKQVALDARKKLGASLPLTVRTLLAVPSRVSVKNR